MIEETARVICVDESGVWVEAERRSTCSACAVNKGCGTAALSRVLGRRSTRMRVLSDQPLHNGDQVIIGIDEQALVRGSLAVYAVPLLALILGALLGELGAKQGLWGDGELASVLLGLGGLAGGLFWLRGFTRAIAGDRHYQPVVLRRIETTLVTGPDLSQGL